MLPEVKYNLCKVCVGILFYVGDTEVFKEVRLISKYREGC